MGAFDKSRPFVASASVGVARTAYDHARQYATQRKTFGKPIFRHQAVNFMLADMATEIQAARHLVRESAWLHDQDEHNTKVAAMAKRFVAHKIAGASGLELHARPRAVWLVALG